MKIHPTTVLSLSAVATGIAYAGYLSQQKDVAGIQASGATSTNQNGALQTLAEA